MITESKVDCEVHIFSMMRIINSVLRLKKQKHVNRKTVSDHPFMNATGKQVHPFLEKLSSVHKYRLI